MLQPEALPPVAAAIPGKLLGEQTEVEAGRERLLVGEGGMGQQELVGDVLAGGETRLVGVSLDQ